MFLKNIRVTIITGKYSKIVTLKKNKISKNLKK